MLLTSVPLQYNDVEFTLWDRFEINGVKDDGKEMILSEFLEYFKVPHFRNQMTVSLSNS